jgi:hypothetical protein
MIRLALGCSAFSNFVTSRQCLYEKLEKEFLQPFCDRPEKLLVRHSVPRSEMLGLLCHGIGMKVEDHMLLSFRSAGICEVVDQLCSALHMNCSRAEGT